MKKQKDIMQTAEKLRREKWIKDKSQQIKELTVKGLEPDIQKLIAKHKAEIKKLKSTHQVKALSHGAIFHATCDAILHLRDVN